MQILILVYLSLCVRNRSGALHFYIFSTLCFQERGKQMLQTIEKQVEEQSSV